MNLIPTSTRPATITLYRGVPFDNKYKEHTLFSHDFVYGDTSLALDNECFLDLVNEEEQYYFPRSVKTGTYNFAYGNGLVTAITLDLEGEEINSNYMKVEIRTPYPPTTITRYYYFITGVLQKNETTYTLNLELDVIQTFGEDFLNNMQHKPVFVERKHCTRVMENGRPHCADLTKADSKFVGVKANHIEKVTHLSLNLKDGNNVRIGNYKWVYIYMREPQQFEQDYPFYTENKIQYPYVVKCFPLVKDFILRNNTGGQIWLNVDGYDVEYCIRYYCSREEVIKIQISPYPPFDDFSNVEETYLPSAKQLIWKLQDISPNTQPDIYTTGYTYHLGEHCEMIFNTISSNPEQVRKYAGGLTLKEGLGGKLYFDEIDLFGAGTVIEPTIEMPKNTNELKLLLSPFKQYFLETYGTEGAEFSPQLRFNRTFSIGPNTAWKMYMPMVVVSETAESNFTFTTAQDQVNPFESKRGDGGTINYLLPTGATAYEHFMNTANAEYTQSKIVSGITNAVKIAGGIGALALSSTGVGAVAGVMGIASGVVGIGSDITSSIAKMEDLKNTANTFNLSGSSFGRDFAMSMASGRDDLYPYIIYYKTDEVILESASDYFYEYGYEVNRDCYFNLDLERDNPQPLVDNNIFNRTNFNYVKINDDITTKCVNYHDAITPMPLVVAKKFNEIFNNGIKLWTFFGNWNLEDTDHMNNPGMYDVFRYFQRHDYDNAEFYNQYGE